MKNFYKYTIVLLLFLCQIVTAGVVLNKGSNATRIKGISIENIAGNLQDNYILKIDITGSDTTFHWEEDLTGGSTDSVGKAFADALGNQINTTYVSTSSLTTTLSDYLLRSHFDDSIANYDYLNADSLRGLLIQIPQGNLQNGYVLKAVIVGSDTTLEWVVDETGGTVDSVGKAYSDALGNEFVSTYIDTAEFNDSLANYALFSELPDSVNKALADALGNQINTTYVSNSALTTTLADYLLRSHFDDSIANYNYLNADSLRGLVVQVPHGNLQNNYILKATIVGDDTTLNWAVDATGGSTDSVGKAYADALGNEFVSTYVSTTELHDSLINYLGALFWDTLGSKDTFCLMGGTDTILVLIRDGTNDTTYLKVPIGALVLQGGSTGIPFFDSLSVDSADGYIRIGNEILDFALIDSIGDALGRFGVTGGSTNADSLRGLVVQVPHGNLQNNYILKATIVGSDTTLNWAADATGGSGESIWDSSTTNTVLRVDSDNDTSITIVDNNVNRTTVTPGSNDSLELLADYLILGGEGISMFDSLSIDSANGYIDFGDMILDFVFVDSVFTGKGRFAGTGSGDNLIIDTAGDGTNMVDVGTHWWRGGLNISLAVSNDTVYVVGVDSVGKAFADALGNQINTTYVSSSSLTTTLADYLLRSNFDDSIANYNYLNADSLRGLLVEVPNGNLQNGHILKAVIAGSDTTLEWAADETGGSGESIWDTTTTDVLLRIDSDNDTSITITDNNMGKTTIAVGSNDSLEFLADYLVLGNPGISSFDSIDVDSANGYISIGDVLLDFVFLDSVFTAKGRFAGSGSGDNVLIDTAGDGTNLVDVSTHWWRSGLNISLVVSNDTVYIIGEDSVGKALTDALGNQINTTYVSSSSLTTTLADYLLRSNFDDSISYYNYLNADSLRGLLVEVPNGNLQNNYILKAAIVGNDTTLNWAVDETGVVVDSVGKAYSDALGNELVSTYIDTAEFNDSLANYALVSELPDSVGKAFADAAGNQINATYAPVSSLADYLLRSHFDDSIANYSYLNADSLRGLLVEVPQGNLQNNYILKATIVGDDTTLTWAVDETGVDVDSVGKAYSDALGNEFVSTYIDTAEFNDSLANYALVSELPDLSSYFDSLEVLAAISDSLSGFITNVPVSDSLALGFAFGPFTVRPAEDGDTIQFVYSAGSIDDTFAIIYDSLTDIWSFGSGEGWSSSDSLVAQILALVSGSDTLKLDYALVDSMLDQSGRFAMWDWVDSSSYGPDSVIYAKFSDSTSKIIWSNIISRPSGLDDGDDVGIADAYDDLVSDGDTAAITSGETKIATSGGVYTFVTGQGYLTGNQSITLSGDVSGTGTTSISTTIGNGVIDTVMFNKTEFSEFVADLCSLMVQGNTEAGITVTFQSDNTIDFSVHLGDSISPSELVDSNTQSQGDIVTIAANDKFGYKTISELGLSTFGSAVDASEMNANDSLVQAAYYIGSKTAGNQVKTKTYIDSVAAAALTTVVSDVDFRGNTNFWGNPYYVDHYYTSRNVMPIVRRAKWPMEVTSRVGGDTTLKIIHPDVTVWPPGFGPEYLDVIGSDTVGLNSPKFTHWMACTPYKNGEVSEQIYVLSTNTPWDSTTWKPPYLVDIHGDTTWVLNPVICPSQILACPEGSVKPPANPWDSAKHLSDPEIFFGFDGYLYILFRITWTNTTNCNANNGDGLMVLYSTNGVNWDFSTGSFSDTTYIYRDSGKCLISPAVILDTNSTYLITVINETNQSAPSTLARIQLYSTKNMNSQAAWQWIDTVNWDIDRGNIGYGWNGLHNNGTKPGHPWHINAITAGNEIHYFTSVVDSGGASSVIGAAFGRSIDHGRSIQWCTDMIFDTSLSKLSNRWDYYKTGYRLATIHSNQGGVPCYELYYTGATGSEVYNTGRTFLYLVKNPRFIDFNTIHAREIDYDSSLGTFPKFTPGGDSAYILKDTALLDLNEDTLIFSAIAGEEGLIDMLVFTSKMPSDCYIDKVDFIGPAYSSTWLKSQIPDSVYFSDTTNVFGDGTWNTDTLRIPSFQRPYTEADDGLLIRVILILNDAGDAVRFERVKARQWSPGR